MEILDIVDDNGIPTGKTVERKTAHREGIQHRTAHLWIARKKGGNIELLLQKRCMEKDSFPGCYDISSAGRTWSYRKGRGFDILWQKACHCHFRIS